MANVDDLVVKLKDKILETMDAGGTLSITLRQDDRTPKKYEVQLWQLILPHLINNVESSKYTLVSNSSVPVPIDVFFEQSEGAIFITPCGDTPPKAADQKLWREILEYLRTKKVTYALFSKTPLYQPNGSISGQIFLGLKY